jgi:ribosomal protein S18 acetylase RimI-like enzyme
VIDGGSAPSRITIRAATPADGDAIWKILDPALRAGETYTLPRDLSRDEALRYWFSPGHEVFVAAADGDVLGTYYLRANQGGGGSHVANCGYITAPWAQERGIATLMCRHSLDHARSRGFLAMQFNIVVSTNERAVRLWQRMGFAIVGTLPKAFRHPTEGLVDAYVMHREL